jgi:pimeloyl-ACP methyl ester carboxylesterase
MASMKERIRRPEQRSEEGLELSAMPHLDGVDHRFVHIDGLRMHLAEAGRGSPVVLLHGFPQHWWEWRGVIPALAREHRVIAPDLRGAGWTDAPTDGYTPERLGADLLGLLDALGLEHVWLVAHDWSSLLAYQLCFEHPERVAGYLCLGAHPFVRFDIRLLAGMRSMGFQFVIMTPGLGPRRLAGTRLPRSLFDDHSAPDYTWTDADLEPFVSRLRDPARARAGSALYRRFIVPEEMRLMRGGYRSKRLTTKTRVLYGDLEGINPALLGSFEECADDMQLEVVEGAAHFLADERPELVAERALALFRD